MISFLGYLWFSAHTADKGNELWYYDIHTGLAYVAADVLEGSASSSPRYLAGYGRRIWFEAYGGDAFGRELYTYNFDTGAVRRQHDTWPGVENGGAADIIGLGDRVYFGASDGTNGDELWSFRLR
jgi:ELWxxDGT repeat protein